MQTRLKFGGEVLIEGQGHFTWNSTWTFPRALPNLHLITQNRWSRKTTACRQRQ